MKAPSEYHSSGASLGHAGSNDHLALIYEDRDGQLPTVTSFVCRGLEQNEQCLYVADDNTVTALRNALRGNGVEVAKAQETGALRILTAEETYLRTGEFDREAVVEFWRDALDRARARGFEGFRAAAEMTWALDSETDPDALAEYETLLNTVYSGEDYTALCQYNRNRFGPEIISDVVRSHPLLTSDGTVHHNTRYKPPEGTAPDRPQQTSDTDAGQTGDTQAPSAPAQSAGPAATDRPVRVLFVDDEPGYSEMVSEYLESHDTIDAVVPETDPQETLQHLEGGSIDCVVSDYSMPGLDGLELLDLVREEHPDLPFVMLTGQSDEETAIEAISAGVTDYFRKRSGTDQYTTLAHRISNVVGQYRTERELVATRRQYTQLIEESTDVIAILDEGGQFKYLSPAAERRLGYQPEELVGEAVLESVHPADRDAVVDRLATLVNEPQQHVSAEFRFEQRDGSWLWIEARGRNLLDDPDVEGIVMHARDITERKDREQTLTALHDSSRDLLDAGSKADVAESVVDTATNVLSMSVVAVYLFDPSEGALIPAAVSSDTVDESSLYPLAPEQNSVIGEVFLDEDPRTVKTDMTATPLAGLPFTEGFLVPVGDHGVCVIGDTESGVTDVDRELVETLMATAGTALDRVERGAKLRERKTELESRNRQFEQLRQLNTTVREIGKTIGQADTRADIARGVCKHLSVPDGIALVRVSGYDSENRRLVPREWEGTTRADGYLDAVSATLGDSTEPAARAGTTEEPVYVANTADELHEEPWRKTALSHGFRSVLSLPLTYKNISYGTLTVYAEQADFFDELSRLALIDLSHKIANVMNAVEHQNAVLSGTMTEVTVRFTDERVPLYYIASRAECSLALETVTPQPGGGIVKHVRVEGADLATVADIAEEVTAISGASPATDTDGSVVELQFSDKPLTDYLADRGIRVLESIADAGSATFTLSVPDTVEVREVFGDLAARYGDPELVAKSERTHADSPSDERYRSKLTPRQQEVLRTAHACGFFESPRACTGEEVADELDVSPQTFYRHVRSAERKLFDTVFDGSE